jgi:hypothetical protein
MIVADLLPPISVENTQLNLKQQVNIKGTCITGCSLLPNGRMVLSCNSTNTVSFINTEDWLVTIIWACLSFFLTQFISQGFDTTTTSPSFSMQVAIVFRLVSILYDSLV